MFHKRWIPIIGCWWLATSVAQACLWDSDTLAMERRRFPLALEVIAGKFLRHSTAYYQWRVQDRQRKIEIAATHDLYGDLAVAFEKLGDTDSAIRAMEEKQARFPNQGEYQSAANLGTFLIHAGRLEEGLAKIEKALELNPDAHFGRERYQKFLVEYVLASRRDGQVFLPLGTQRDADLLPGFAGYLLDESAHGDRSQLPIREAIKGILGMMRFGQHESPVLFEVLGDLLLAAGYPDDSKRLATRAYLRAAQTAEEPAVKAAYRSLAEKAIDMQSGRRNWEQLPLTELEAQLHREVADAEAFVSQIAADEAAWIAAGLDVDQAFADKYFQTPSVELPKSQSKRRQVISLLFVGLLSFTLVLMIIRVKTR